MDDEFKYDVAFSFLEADLQVALQIADRIRDRVNVFVYSERQGVFAGTDGVDQHMHIYEDEARIVVILYRDTWGQTEWTRVEETAIRNRGFKEGHDFLVFVPLDNSAKPKWLPKTRIWVGFDRYGIDGVASAIEAAVQGAGGMVRAESVADYAARIDRGINFHNERRAFLHNEQGVKAATEEVEVLFNELQQMVREVNEQTGQVKLEFQRPSSNFCRVSTAGIRFDVTWHIIYRNTVEGAELTFNFSEGGRFLGGQELVKPTFKESVSYDVDLDLSKRAGWRESQYKKKFFTSTQLAEFWIKNLLDRIRDRTDRQL